MDVVGWILFSTVRSTYLGGVKLFETTSNAMKLLGQTMRGISLSGNIVNKSKKNCLIIKVMAVKNMGLIKVLKGIFDEKYRYLDYFKIVDNNGNIKYTGKYKYLAIKKRSNSNYIVIELYDSEDKKIGYIENINPVELNKNTKICSIYKEDEKILSLKKYEKNNDISVSEENEKYSISFNKLNAYEFKFEKKTKGKLNLTRDPVEKRYISKYVLEYENKEDEVLSILISLGVEIINS